MNLFDCNCLLGRRSARPAASALSTAAEMLGAMDRYGIAEALVVHAMALDGHPVDGNARVLRETAGHPRLHPCWVLLPDTGEMPHPAETVRQMQAAGVRAARMYPLTHRFAFTEANLAPTLNALADASIPLFVDFGVAHWSSTNTDWAALAGVCARRPDLTVVVVGEGIGAPRRLYPMWQSLPNLRLETSYYQVHQGLAEVAARFGPERLLFGSGMPDRVASLPIAQLGFEGLSPADRDAIAGGTLRALLGRTSPAAPAAAPAWLRPGSADRPIIDAHAHLGRWFSSYVHAGDAASMVATMDRLGVCATAIVAFDAIGPDMVGGNTQVAEAMRDHPGRFIGYATVDPNAGGDAMVRELERTVVGLGFRGIKFHCDTHACPADSDRYRPALEFADAHALPVLVHGQITAAMLADYPGARFLAAHTGAWDGRSANATIDLCGAYPNLICELCSSVSHEGALERLVERVGADRIVHGSDTPLMDAGYQLGRVLGADLDEGDRDRILYRNAHSLFFGQSG